MGKAKPWPEADTKKAIELWESGMSGAQVAAALDWRYSRSSVIAQVNRMGYTRMAKDGRFLPKAIPKPDRTADVIDKHDRGERPSEIARALRMSVEAVTKILKANDIDPTENVRPAYKIHPMWSMPEDERRIAFYEKFRAGWAEVQERLNAGN